MNQRERNDALIRAALTPAASASLTAGLADGIHDMLHGIPQDPPRSRWLLGRRRRFGPLRSMIPVLVIVGLLLLALAVAAILASRPAQPRLGVLAYRGGPERTGVMAGPGPTGDPILLWQFRMSDAVAVMPVVDAGTVYVADLGGKVQALDEATGRADWTRDVKSPVNGSPAIAGDRLFLGTDAGEVLALDVKTGNLIWRFKASGAIRSSSVVVGALLYVGSDDGMVYALDAVSGQRRWATDLGAPVTRGVAVSSGVVYAGATGGGFKALDAATGVVRWTADPLGAGEVGTPMVADGRVFVSSGLLEVGPSDRITTLDIRTGKEIWHFAAADAGPVYNGAVDGGAVYVSTNGGDVFRLDAVTGRVAPGWPFHAGGAVGYLVGLVDGVIYACAGDRLIYAVDIHTASERWRFAVGALPNVPAVIDGRLFVGTNLGKVLAIGGAELVPSASP